MLTISSYQAHINLREQMKLRRYRIPPKSDSQFHDNAIFPNFTPKFKLFPGEKIFTIGSCFARNIETALLNTGFDVPVKNFKINDGEMPKNISPTDILNEYNPGTILQRIELLVNQTDTNLKAVEMSEDGKYTDLLLHIYSEPVFIDRLKERREEIRSLYNEILSSQPIVITLGLVECWFDSIDGCYLNKAPSKKNMDISPDRYSLHRMDSQDVLTRLTRAIELINSLDKKKIIITVSPIPLEATFTDQPAVMANSYSKAVLRIVSEQLRSSFDNVDYFPSYEIVSSGGVFNFYDDNTHITPEIVPNIIKHMLKIYC